MTDKERNAKEKGTEHELKGAKKEGTGKLEKEAGRMTGDRSTQAKGAAKEAAGKVQKKAGEATRKSAD